MFPGVGTLFRCARQTAAVRMKGIVIPAPICLLPHASRVAYCLRTEFMTCSKQRVIVYSRTSAGAAEKVSQSRPRRSNDGFVSFAWRVQRTRDIAVDATDRKVYNTCFDDVQAEKASGKGDIHQKLWSNHNPCHKPSLCTINSSSEVEMNNNLINRGGTSM